MFTLNNKPLPLDTAFEINGIKYPSNWLRLSTASEKAAIGITETAEPESYDDRFYWGVNAPKQLEDREEVDQDGEPLYVQEYDAETESMVNTSQRLVTKGLKSNWSSQIKETTNKLLASTDWMVTRKYERDIAIPTTTATYRLAVLTECDRLLEAISTTTTVEELAEVLAAQQWPTND